MRCSHIAVMQTADAALAGVETCAAIVLWTRAAAGRDWTQGPPLPFSLAGCDSMAALRERLRQLAGRLPQGAALVATGISGLAYNELSRLGFCLCELAAFTPAVLEPLAAEIEAKAPGGRPRAHRAGSYSNARRLPHQPHGSHGRASGNLVQKGPAALSGFHALCGAGPHLWAHAALAGRTYAPTPAHLRAQPSA